MMMKRLISAILFVIIMIGGGIGLYHYYDKEAGVSEHVSTSESVQKEEPAKEQKEEKKIDEPATLKPDVPDEEPETEEEEGKVKEALKTVVEDTIHALVEEDLHITAVGDSLTQGVGDETENGGYLGFLEEDITSLDGVGRIKVSNFGKRGNRTDQLLKRLDEKQIQAAINDADIILVTIGANDVMKVVKKNFLDLKMEPFTEEQAHYEKRLNSIFEKIRAENPDAPIYLIGLFNPFYKWFAEIEELDLILQNWNVSSQVIANKYENIHFIPVEDLFRNTEEDLFYKDNFHPNTEGYERIASRVFTTIQPTVEAHIEEAKQEEEEE